MNTFDYNTNDNFCQDCGAENFDSAALCGVRVLQDRTAYGRVRPWDTHKKQSRKLAALYRYVNLRKAELMEQCADWLGYRRDGEGYKLNKANFCRVRLCPMCQWRRSLKVYGQMTRICQNIDWNDYAAVHLTLTVRNCQPTELSAALDNIMEGFHRLIKYKEVGAAVKGSYKAVEITINNSRGDPWLGTMHPHIHALLVVKKSYFKSRYYIKHARWVELWRKACGLDYDPDVSVQRVAVDDGQTITDALREVAKYSTKATDITETPLDPVEYLQVLDAALNGRRFVSFSGILKELHKALNLTDPTDDGDLIHADEIESTLDEQTKEDVYYIWRSGLYVEWNPDDIQNTVEQH